METQPVSYVGYPANKDKAAILSRFLPTWLMCHHCIAFAGFLLVLALYSTALAIFPRFDLPGYWLGRFAFLSPFIGFVWMNHVRRKRLAQARTLTAAQLGPTTFTLGDEGLIVTSTTARTVLFWPGITDFFRGPNGLLVMRGPLNQTAIPTAAFASPAEMEAFAQALRARIPAMTEAP